MLFPNSETNTACRRMVFSRSVSDSLSHTIRIRAPSGTAQLIAPTVLIAHLDSYAIYSPDVHVREAQCLEALFFKQDFVYSGQQVGVAIHPGIARLRAPRRVRLRVARRHLSSLNHSPGCICHCSGAPASL